MSKNRRTARSSLRTFESLEARRLMSVSVVATSGDALLSGNGTFATFGPVSLSDNGQVAFAATLDDTSSTDNSDTVGVFRGTAGRVQTVAQAGDTYGPMGSPQVYNEFGAGSSTRPIAIGANGTVAFTTQIRNSLTNDITSSIVAVPSLSTTPSEIARADLAAPDTGSYATNAVFSAPTISPNGTVAFSANASRGDGSTQIVVAREPSGSPTTLSRNNVSVDGNGNINFVSSPPLVNDSGNAAMRVTFTGGTGGSGVVYAPAGSAASVVARVGTVVPLTGGATFLTIGTPIQFNASNQIAFTGTYSVGGGPASGAGIFRATGSNPFDALVSSGDGKPSGMPGAATFGTFGSVIDMNSSGAVMFKADNALYIDDGSGTPDAVANGEGLIAGFGFLVSVGANNQFAINDAGHVVWEANRGGNTNQDDGLFFQSNPGGAATKVVAEGDALLGSTVTSFSLAIGAANAFSSQGAAAQATYDGFNNSDQVAFNFTLADGRTGVAIWTPDSNGNLDFGDAPDSYGTTLANDGARASTTSVFLGSIVDPESDGIPTPGADGDTIDAPDEDGVSFGAGLTAGQSTVVTVVASQTAVVDAYIDFNANGVFNGNERVVASKLVSAGSNALTISVPSDAVVGNTYARFRISTAGGTSPLGLSNDGEVEDYLVAVATNPTSPPPPSATTVTVAALDGLAAETAGNTATLRFTRTGSTASPLTVTYSRTGTATFGTDYSGATGTVDIPAGSAFADVTLIGIDNSNDDGDRSATLTVTDGTGYSAGTTKTVVVPIADDDPPETVGATVGADFQIVGGVTKVKAGNFVGGARGGAARVRIGNVVDATANASGLVSVSFYASLDGAVEVADTPIVTVTKQLTLKPGKTKDISAKFNYPTGLLDGSYFIVARVDSASAITEFRELNNDAASSVAIGIAAPFVDYSATSVSTKVVPITPGTKSAKQKPTVILLNRGNSLATASITTRFFLSTDSVIDGSDTPVGDLVKVVKVKPGKTAKLKASVTVPTGIAAGSYFLLARVDAGFAVTEPNELDNDVAGPSLTIVAP